MRGEGLGGMRRADIAVVLGLDDAALIFLDAAALLDPGEAIARQTRIDVDGDVRVGVGAGGVVHRQVRLAGALAEDDLAERHLHVGRGCRRREDLARGGQGPRGDGGKGGVGVGANVHGILLVISQAALADWPSHCLTRASGSAFWVTSETTAMESAPAAKISGACSNLMPPIATSRMLPTRFFHSVILGMPCGANRIDFKVVKKIGPSAT